MVANSRTRKPPRQSADPHANYASSNPAPTPADRRRYHQFRDGTSAEEIAARENVRVTTIHKSIKLMRTYNAQYSQESAEVETRRIYLDALPQAANVFAEALAATSSITKSVVKSRWNDRTQQQEDYLDEVTELVPDHATRMKATERLEKLLLSIQPRTPMVQVDARSQMNVQHNQLGNGAPTLSFEAITRQIRAERGLLGSGDNQPVAVAELSSSVPVEVDYELQEELAEEGDEEEDESNDANGADKEHMANDEVVE